MLVNFTSVMNSSTVIQLNASYFDGYFKVEKVRVETNLCMDSDDDGNGDYFYKCLHWFEISLQYKLLLFVFWN